MLKLFRVYFIFLARQYKTTFVYHQRVRRCYNYDKSDKRCVFKPLSCILCHSKLEQTDKDFTRRYEPATLHTHIFRRKENNLELTETGWGCFVPFFSLKKHNTIMCCFVLCRYPVPTKVRILFFIKGSIFFHCQ